MDAKDQSGGGRYQRPPRHAPRHLIREKGHQHVQEDRGRVPAGRSQAEERIVDAKPNEVQRPVIVGWDAGPEMLPHMPDEISRHESPRLNQLVGDELPGIVQDKREAQRGRIDQSRKSEDAAQKIPFARRCGRGGRCG